MSEHEANAVAEYLIAHCVGRANAMTKRDLAQALGVDERALHDVLADLIETHHLPVCSACEAPMGYYLATSAEEKRPTVSSLARRAIAIFRRRRALKRAPLWPWPPVRQPSLFEVPRPEEVRHSLAQRNDGRSLR